MGEMDFYSIGSAFAIATINDKTRNSLISLEDEVVADIMRHFRSSHNFEIRCVNGEFRQGVLVIYGQVSSYYLKQLAQELARSLTGVNRIVNRLDVIYPQTIRNEIEA